MPTRSAVRSRTRGRRTASLPRSIVRLIRDAPELRRDYEQLAVSRAAGQALPKGRNFH
jgi:hypothetical protein